MMRKVVISWAFFAFAATLVASDDQYLPCKGWMSFSYDDSNTLSSADFKTQMNFIKASIKNMSHPERLRVEGAFTGEFNWDSPLSLSQMQTAIDGAQQTSNSYSLAQQLAGILTSAEMVGSTFDQIEAVIFISDTSDRALANADRWFSLLKNVNVTFVVLGDAANSTKLSAFSDNIFSWEDLSTPGPDSWDNFVAFGCGALQVKCKNDIAILIDQSLDVKNSSNFQNQIDFLTTSLIPSWNTIDMKNTETFAMLYSTMAATSLSTSPFLYKNKDAFIADIANARNQSLQGYDSMQVGFQFLLSQLQSLRNGHDFTVIVFTYTDYMVNVQNALPYTKQINGNIIIVGVGQLDPFALQFITNDVIITDKDFNGDVTAKINAAICQ